jgi:site-specific DNA-methyltransferase (adenine-specific)
VKNNPLPRLDRAGELREELMRHCRLKAGEVWEDPLGRHRVGCLDAADGAQVASLMRGEAARLAIQDPPYNLAAFERRGVAEYVAWCQRWVELTVDSLADDAAFYVWLGADQNDGFQPLADFMVMMRGIPGVKSRSFITLRNQRGYGTSHNWMAVRQELLYYTKGNPPFHVQYTAIPKVLRGYYKEIGGRRTENLERSRSENIRASNVWVDVQQVFYRMEENVSGCYAQKPLEAIDRIVQASSSEGELVIDFFAHSGTALLSCERLGRRCFTADVDPIYCEIAVRRLERFREKGLLGWQNGHAFEDCFAESTLQPISRPRSAGLTARGQQALF